MLIRVHENGKGDTGMTMPHLMNCSHSGDGWCLDCVKELWDECDAWRKAKDVADQSCRFLYDAVKGSKFGRELNPDCPP